jgi:hypothetical protein
MTKSTSLAVFETDVHLDADGRFSLNDIHKAAMAKGHATDSQRPANFLKSAPVSAYIQEIDRDATGIASVLSLKGGKHQGTYAVRLVALRYAGWLSPKVEVEVYDTFDRFLRADESLTNNLIDRHSQEELKRLAVRAQGRLARNALTSTLAAHGVTGRGYADCTNAIYTPILGGPAKQILEARQLKPKTNLREHMTGKELAAVMLSEEIARERIDETNARGNQPCANECQTAARRVRSIL